MTHAMRPLATAVVVGFVDIVQGKIGRKDPAVVHMM